MMTEDRSGSVFGLLYWQWKFALLFVAAGGAAFGVHYAFHYPEWLKLPALPLAVVGGALGIFVSFRTNQAYDRWWEGRKLWGRMINTSRHICTQLCVYLPRGASEEPGADARRMVHRHVAYVHALRCLLRKQDPHVDPDAFVLLDAAEREALRGESNITHALLHKQLEELTAMTDRDELSEFRLADLDESVRHLLDIQGGCERIKKTPLPRGYAFIANRLVIAYSLIFPFTVVDKLGWTVIPLNLLVCLAFTLISEVGRVLEDPFNMYYNGLPLMAISRTIEVNVRQRLGEKDLPEIPEPIKGILM